MRILFQHNNYSEFSISKELERIAENSQSNCFSAILSPDFGEIVKIAPSKRVSIYTLVYLSSV